MLSIHLGSRAAFHLEEQYRHTSYPRTFGGESYTPQVLVCFEEYIALEVPHLPSTPSMTRDPSAVLRAP